MCIIAVYKKGTIIREKELETMWRRNDDGAGYGFYVRESKKWRVIKGLMKLEELKESLRENNFLETELKTSVVIHFRAATHGGVSKSLTHPFKILTKDKEVLLFHNGVFNLSGIGYGKRSISFKIPDLYDWEYGCGNYCEIGKTTSDSDEDDSEIDPTDPTKLKTHSDTSLLCYYLSELNFDAESIVKILNSPLLEGVISGSRICLCIEGEEEPVLIGNWIEDAGKFYSNSGYKDYYYDYGKIYSYKSSSVTSSTISTTTSYPLFNPLSKYYDDDDSDDDYFYGIDVYTEQEIEKEFRKNIEKVEKATVKTDRATYWKLRMEKIAGVILNEYCFLPTVYYPKGLASGKYKLEVHKNELYMELEESGEIYLVTFLKEYYDKYLKKYNFKNRIGIAVDENFNLFYVQKSKGKIKLHPVRKLLQYPVFGYFVKNGKLIEIKDYTFVDFEFVPENQT